jgi:hypothetical protein
MYLKTEHEGGLNRVAKLAITKRKTKGGTVGEKEIIKGNKLR